MILKGSCLCGGVTFEAEGPLMAMARCHCVQCRKASGAEFATNGSVASDQFHIRTGEELISRYESSPGNFRHFCGRCGSPLFKRYTKQPYQVRLRLGCLDTELEQGPSMHVFVSEKPGWSEICDASPQFPTRPGA